MIVKLKTKLLSLIVGLTISVAAFAEATFEQVEAMIAKQQYSQAVVALEVIVHNHPKSAKAFYAMAQAQAGLGNQEKAKRALDIATGLNPKLDFAPSGHVEDLKVAVTPRTELIKPIEESHAELYALLIVFAGACTAAAIYFYTKRENEKVEERERQERLRKLDEQWKVPPTKRYTNSSGDSGYVKSSAYSPSPVTAAATTQPSVAAPAPTTTIINNTTQPVTGSSGPGFGTGLVVGGVLGHLMTSDSGSRHRDSSPPYTPIAQPETISKSWDDTPAPAPSYSSNSWDSDDRSSSSSGSDYSWDSGSSSSDSSSSWD